MTYEWLKILHVISATVLFGTGIGTALYMFLVNLQKDISLIAKATKQVVFADWCFTGTSGFIQAVTGVCMIAISQHHFLDFWVIGSIVGYCIAAMCWFPVVYLQIKCRDIAFAAIALDQPLPRRYYRFYTTWWILGIPAFLSLIGVFYLMANRPVFA